MSYPTIYASLKEMFRREALHTRMARAIARKADLRLGQSLGRRYTTALRSEYWSVYSGTPTDPISGDNYASINYTGDPAPAPYPNPNWAQVWFWVEGFTEVRVVAKMLEPHSTAQFATLWRYGPDPEDADWYWPDSRELVILGDFPPPAVAGDVWCPMSAEINVSPWCPINEVWMGHDTIMALFVYGAADSEENVQAGIVEVHLR